MGSDWCLDQNSLDQNKNVVFRKETLTFSNFQTFYYFYSVHVEFKTSITPSDNCACSDPECSDPRSASLTSRTQLQVAVRHEGPRILFHGDSISDDYGAR